MRGEEGVPRRGGRCSGPQWKDTREYFIVAPSRRPIANLHHCLADPSRLDPRKHKTRRIKNDTHRHCLPVIVPSPQKPQRCSRRNLPQRQRLAGVRGSRCVYVLIFFIFHSYFCVCFRVCMCLPWLYKPTAYILLRPPHPQTHLKPQRGGSAAVALRELEEATCVLPVYLKTIGVVLMPGNLLVRMSH